MTKRIFATITITLTLVLLSLVGCNPSGTGQNIIGKTEKPVYMENIQNVQVANGEDVDIDKIAEQIKIGNPKFEPTLYITTVDNIANGRFTVEFVRVIGGFETDSKYIVNVRDFKMEKIIDQCKENKLTKHRISEKKLERIRNDKKLFEKACANAREEISQLKSIIKHVDQQQVKYFYDINEDKKQIIIFSTCSRYPKDMENVENEQRVYEYTMDV